jgi:hypothetical protein
MLRGILRDLRSETRKRTSVSANGRVPLSVLLGIENVLPRDTFEQARPARDDGVAQKNLVSTDALVP